jgi:dipeptidyl aminopeptidase/acylaminoacyl peptidase
MRTASLSLCLLVLAVAACAQAPSPPAATAASATSRAPAQPPIPAANLPAGLPPLIDRELFFDDPEISGGQVSPDGKYISFRRPYKGVVNIWVKRREEAFDAARPITADAKRPVTGYFWSEDATRILYVQDKGGDENFRIYAVDPAAPAEAATGVPPARDLTPFPGVRAEILAVPESAPGTLIVGLNDRDPQLHDVYRLDMATGKRELMFKNQDNVVEWSIDLAGRLRLGVRVNSTGGTEILRVDGKKLVIAYTCNAEEACSPIRFHKDGKRVYLVTNKGQPDLTRLVLFNPKTKREELVESDPEHEVDFSDARFSDATEELVATFYEGDRLRTYPRSPKFKHDYEMVRKALPDGDLRFLSTTEDDRLQLVSVSSDVDPGAVHLYDRATGKVEFLFRPRPKLPIQHLATMKPVHYQARDGLSIPAYLTIPKGVEPRNLPSVLLPHGGPWARDSWGYNGWAQFLANRGYAVLQPNFRGSTGYGKKFINLGNKQWGTGTMQHDLTDAAKWLASEGIADPRRIGINGGSYGGYATLAGVTFTPDLYAAAVDLVGPSSIITLLQSLPPYWAPVKKIFAVRVGDMEDPAELERLKAQSPLYSAKAIKTPLLVIQGANDPRVKRAESDQIVVALRDSGRPVEYLVASDEGHGFQGKENRLAMFAGMERFLARHLGGRYQESVPAPIAERLASLTVDVKKVEAKGEGGVGAAATGKPVAPQSSAPAKLPAFSGDALRPATLRYAYKGQLMGRSIEGSSTLTIAAGKQADRAVWTISEVSKTSLGDGTDTTVVDKKTMLPIGRSMRQGPATIDIELTDKTARGKLKAGPQELPIDVKLDGAVMVDGMPLNLAIGTLPLAPGYKTTLRSFDVMGGKAQIHDLEVKSTEDVTTPAGKFSAVRVQIAPREGSGGTTLWVEHAAPHRILRYEATVPAQRGGGKVSAELVDGGN